MSSSPVATVLLEGIGEIEHVVDAVRWIAPHVTDDADETVVLTALELGELLPSPADALWLWWIASRRPELVVLDDVLCGSALPAELVEILEWSASRGPSGLAEFHNALDLGKNYFQALRELERKARDFPTLTAFVSAIRRGDADLGRVYGSIPGAYDNPGVRESRSQIMFALAARDEAIAAGMPLDLPPFRRTMLRFEGVQGAAKAVCLTILSELSGEEPLGSAPHLLYIDPSIPLAERARRAQELQSRGLPIDEAAFGTPAEWSALLSSPPADCVLPGPGAQAVRGLSDVLSKGMAIEAWWDGVVSERDFWGNHVDAAFASADRALTARQREELRLRLLLRAEQDVPDGVHGLLVQARREHRMDAAGALALQRALNQLDAVLSQAEEACSW